MSTHTISTTIGPAAFSWISSYIHTAVLQTPDRYFSSFSALLHLLSDLIGANGAKSGGNFNLLFPLVKGSCGVRRAPRQLEDIGDFTVRF